MKRLGLFGGTFDPVHLGHLVPARTASRVLGLDALLFIPGARPPHKLGDPLTSFVHRFAMLALATQGQADWYVSEVEQDRAGPTYTIDTLTELARSMPAEETFFLMGSDSFAQITTWHRWSELVDLAHLVVLHRPGVWGRELASSVPGWLARRIVSLDPSRELGEVSADKKVFVLEHEPLPISATRLREALRQGARVTDLVPPQVEQYALKYHLYQQGDSHSDGP